eukprot:scaffold14880_cov90-Skeletonema_marinoi.AAC.3
MQHTFWDAWGGVIVEQLTDAIDWKVASSNMYLSSPVSVLSITYRGRGEIQDTSTPKRLIYSCPRHASHSSEKDEAVRQKALPPFLTSASNLGQLRPSCVIRLVGAVAGRQAAVEEQI